MEFIKRKIKQVVVKKTFVTDFSFFNYLIMKKHLDVKSLGVKDVKRTACKNNCYLQYIIILSQVQVTTSEYFDSTKTDLW